MTIDYQLKDLSKTEKELTATIPQEYIDKASKQTLEQLRKDANIKGFRPGKAPDHILEQHYGKEFIEMRSLDYALQLTYSEIINKEDVRACARPEVKIDDNDLHKFVATIPVLPEVKIDYASIKIEKKSTELDPKELEVIKNDLLRYGRSYKDVERAAKLEDRAELEFEGFDEDGTAVPNTKSSNHPVILGEGSLIPGFEENVVGMKVGEEKDFDITFPADYHEASFQNRKMKFHIKLQRLEEGTDPELNRELIKRLTGRDQEPEEFFKEAEENLKKRKETEERRRQENDYIKALTEKLDLELPKALIHDEVHYIIDEIKQNVASRKQNWEDFLKSEATTEKELHEKYKDEAERRIKVRLALNYVIAEEKIDVTEEDLKAELEKIKAQYPEKEHAKIENDFAKGELKYKIANKLALDKLFEKVLN